MTEAREFEGKNVDQALFLAAQELNSAPEDLVYEVLERRPDRVRIRVEPARERAPSETRPARPPASDPGRAPRRGRPGAPERAAAGPRERRRETGGDGEAGEAEAPWSGAPRYGSLPEMVQALVSAAGLDLTVEVESEGEGERVTIDGPDAELLLENDAEALSALEHLLGKMALRGVGRRARIRVDSAGWRKRREDELVQMALRSAEKVKQEGGEQATGPLNPYERRLVHMALKDDPSILTHSVGDGFLKRVTIRTKSPSE